MPEDDFDLTEAVQVADPKVLAERLKEARIQSGLRQEDAAERLGVARTTVINIEKATRPIRADELVALASLYGRQLHEILRPEPPAAPLATQFRVAPARPADDGHLHEATIQLQRLCDDYMELERIVAAPLARREAPEYAIEGTEQAPEEIAAAERNRLSLGDGPLVDFRSLLENEVGLRIFFVDLPSRVAGLYAYNTKLGGCIAINLKHPRGRQNLSLAHEYAHYLTARMRAEVTILYAYARVPETERFADEFARHFLMPAIGVIRHFNNLKRSRTAGPNKGDLVRMAHSYGVSLEAMVLRLEELRLVRSGTWDRLRASGFKVTEARDLLDLSPEPPDTEEMPRRYTQLAVEAFFAGMISEGQLAQFLRTDRLRARQVAQRAVSQYALDPNGTMTQVELDLAEA